MKQIYVVDGGRVKKVTEDLVSCEESRYWESPQFETFEEAVTFAISDLCTQVEDLEKKLAKREDRR